MSVDFRMSQDKAKKSADHQVSIQQVLNAVQKYLGDMRAYDKIEILMKQNGRGYSIHLRREDRIEIDDGEQTRC